MSMGGLLIHNIYLLDDFIQMAFEKYGELQQSAAPNYFNRSKWSVKTYYAAKAHEFLAQRSRLHSYKQSAARCAVPAMKS